MRPVSTHLMTCTAATDLRPLSIFRMGPGNEANVSHCVICILVYDGKPSLLSKVPTGHYMTKSHTNCIWWNVHVARCKSIVAACLPVHCALNVCPNSLKVQGLTDTHCQCRAQYNFSGHLLLYETDP